jgi:hypothetical protein
MAALPPSERRQSRRARGVATFANKYIDGTPHLVRVLDVSCDGLLVERLLEPESHADTFPVELFIGGFTTWAWTRRVWRRKGREALRIVAADPLDRARIRKFLRALVA